MGITAVDTSVVVAALLAWHERHEDALAVLRETLARGDDLVLPGHALVESYAVLTRMPSPHRIAPGAAHELLRGSFGDQARIVTLSGRDIWTLLRKSSEAAVAGGRTYDARILAAARKARADRLLTLDERDYAHERMDTGAVRVVVPGRGR